MYRKFAKWLADNKMSKEAFAHMVGCSRSMISHIACGRRRPGRDLSIVIGVYTSIDPGEWKKKGKRTP